MKIAVEMTAEEYDMFREYQKDRASLEKELSEDYEILRKRHERLCNAVLNGIEETESTLYADEKPQIKEKRPQIRNAEDALEAVNMAADWYA